MQILRGGHGHLQAPRRQIRIALHKGPHRVGQTVEHLLTSILLSKLTLIVSSVYEKDDVALRGPERELSRLDGLQADSLRFDFSFVFVSFVKFPKLRS